MKLTIKTLDQKNFQIKTYGLKTVRDLKRKLFNSATTNLLPDHQQIVYAGRVLKDHKLLSNYSIDERKFLLVMARKSSKGSNKTEYDKPTIKNKSKRLAEKKTQQPNVGQGDEVDIICYQRKKNQVNLVKGSKPATTLTRKKSLKIKPPKVVSTQAALNKVKVVKKRNSKTSSWGASSQEYIVHNHRPTSSTFVESSDLQRSGRRNLRLIRNKGNSMYKNKSAKSTMSLLSGTKSCAKKRVSKIRVNRKRRPKKTRQKECDEFVLRQIVAMGYDEDDVRRALIASFNDPNEAVDYLIQQVQERIEQKSARKKQQQQPQQKHKSFRIIEPVKKEKKTNALAFLRHDRDFKNLRRLLRSRPNVLQSLIKRIGASHPELLCLLKEHENDFLQLLHEKSADSEDEYCSKSNYNPMHISPEEEKLITRLVRMGFKRQMVVLAFITCDRNVEKAVDYLCRIGDTHI